MFEVEKAPYEISFDRQSYKNWLHSSASDKKYKFLKKALIRAIGELPQKQKQYILLWMEGMTMREIARTCGVDASTVSRTIKRGRIRLKRMLTPIVEWNTIFCEF